MVGLLTMAAPSWAKDGEVEVNVDQSSSTLQYSVTLSDMSATTDIPSNNYRIRGEVLVDKSKTADSTYISVNATQIPMRHSGETFYLNLKGNIGGYPPSTTPIQVTFSGKKAVIDLIGDLDESTVTIETTNGAYNGTLIITAIIL